MSCTRLLASADATAPLQPVGTTSNAAEARAWIQRWREQQLGGGPNGTLFGSFKSFVDKMTSGQ